MKIRNLIATVFIGLATFISCDMQDTELGAPSLTLDSSEITFTEAGGEDTLTLTSSRAWTAKTEADWLVVSPEGGDAAAESQTVVITALENTGMDREATVTFSIGMTNRYLTVKQAGPEGSVEQLIVYYNDFDKEKAEKGANGWDTYLDKFDGWMNATGTGAENCGFKANGMTARTNDSGNSASQYSDYEGSGMNYLWFAKKNYFMLTDITLDTTKTNYTLSFGTERNLYEAEDNTFNPEEFKVYISEDAEKWVELEYSFPNGYKNRRWDLASTTFTLPNNVRTLNIYFTATVASAYLMDDLKLMLASEEGKMIDFTTGTDIDDGTNIPTPENITDVTIKEFLAAEVSESVWYRIKGAVSGNINTEYGNFDVKDSTDSVYVYGISNWSEYKSKVSTGGTITVIGTRGEYNSKVEMLNGYIESYDESTETNDPLTPAIPDAYPTEEPTLTPVTIEEFLAKPVSYTEWYQLTGIITEIAKAQYGNIYIKDETGTVYIYGLTSQWIGAKNDQSFSDIANLSVGDTITIGTLRQDYNGNPQGGGSWCAAWYISHIDGEAPAEEVDDSDETIVISDLITAWGYTENQELSQEEAIQLNDNISITYTKQNNSTSNFNVKDMGLRWYQSDVLKFSSTKAISKLEFETYDSKNGPVTADTGSMDATGLIWTGDAAEITFTATAQIRVSKIKITYVK